MEYILLNDTFCPLLFQHLATHPHGGVTHCCVADHKNAISSSKDNDTRYYNLNRDTVHDTFNSKTFRDARLKVLNGEKPQACLRCYEEESKGIRSKRVEELYNYSDYTLEIAQTAVDNTGYISDVQFEFVELRLGNVCNVACRTCNPASSSKWVNDYNKLAEVEKNSKYSFINQNLTKSMEGFRWPEREEFWEDLLQHCDRVKTFYINGGEPTLIKQHFKFLQRLIDMGKTDIKLWYNINMTNINEEIIDIWRQFDLVKVSCSIDDLGRRNEYIRYPTKWEDVMRNFLRLKEEKFEMDITQTLSWMNYMSAADFYDFFVNQHNTKVNHNFVYDPSILSPGVLPKEMRNSAHETFVNVFPENIYNQFTNMFSNDDNTLMWKRAIAYTNALDKIRNQNISDYLQEFKCIPIK